MKFKEIENLWTVDLNRLSRAGQGQVYYERAKVVLDRALKAGELQLHGKRVKRSWLTERIGCKLGTASQNRRIRDLLFATDARVAKGGLIAEGDASEPAPLKTNDLPSEAPPTNARARRTAADLGLIVLTDATCKLDGVDYAGIPTIVWPEGIDESASDWMRYAIVVCGIATSSAEQYAQVLRIFLRLCRNRRRHWSTVDDAFLIVWREHMLRAQNLEPERVNFCLDVVFAFLVWAERTGLVRGLVGLPRVPDDQANQSIPSTYAVNARISNGRRRSNKLSFGWTTPLHVSVPSKSAGKRHTPTEDQVRNIHDLAIERRHGERNSLLHSWAEETGGRRAELLRITVQDLPSLDQLDEMIANDRPWTVHIIRKGGKRGQLRPQQDLLIRSLDYVRFERQHIVDSCRDSIVGYSEPRELFLSSSTGQVLHPDSLTSLSRQLFRAAGIKKASFHRLRAKHIVEVIDALVEAATEGGKSVNPEAILIAAAEELGHSHIESLRPYLNYVLNRRTRNAEATKFHNLTVRIRQLELREQSIVQRLATTTALQDAGRLIQLGKTTQAAKALRQLADAMSSEPQREHIGP